MAHVFYAPNVLPDKPTKVTGQLADTDMPTRGLVNSLADAASKMFAT